MGKQKKGSLKISNTLMILGGIVMVLGIVFLAMSISNYKNEWNEFEKKEAAADAAYQQELADYEKALSDYQVDYDEWHEQWVKGEAELSDAPQRPYYPTKNNMINLDDLPDFPIMIVVSVVMLVGGVGLVIYGAKPYITKFALKHKKETLDYAGNDMTNIGTTMVDIGAPVVNKAVDDVITPAVKKVRSSMADKQGDSNAKVFCQHCGNAIDKDAKFCSHCGKEQ